MYNNIKSVHLEITENCNASCLQCDRNENGGVVNKYLKKRELTLEDIKTIFPPEFISNLKRMYMCGNYGDPCCAKDTLEVFQYFRECNPNINLGMNTNGGIRNPEWWMELADVTDYIKFSIDGLWDTNHLYRQGTRFERIIDNAQAFIDGGGNAHWDYLIFGHNEHQVNDAQNLSIAMGFKQFITKKTGRFFSTITYKGKETHEGLEKPKSEKFQNKALAKEKLLIEKYGSMDEYLKQTDIECKVLKEESIYISAEGLVLPCCWLAGQLYKWYWKPRQAPIWKMIENKDDINAKLFPISKIINEYLFKRIKRSWTDESRLKVCALKCGLEFDPFKEQFK